MFLNIKFSLISLLSVIFVNIGTAQVVKGKVYDNITKEKLYYVNLIFTDSLNEKVSCITDIDGAYSIDLKKFGTYKVLIQSVNIQHLFVFNR